MSPDTSPPEPANDNLRLLREGESPLEFLVWIERTRREMSEELAEDPGLHHCPKHRNIREELNTMEACFRWRQAAWETQP